MDNPWISIIGVGEDGLAGFCAARQEALSNADLVFGPPRHLELVGVQGTAHVRGPCHSPMALIRFWPNAGAENRSQSWCLVIRFGLVEANTNPPFAGRGMGVDPRALDIFMGGKPFGMGIAVC